MKRFLSFVILWRRQCKKMSAWDLTNIEIKVTRELWSSDNWFQIYKTKPGYWDMQIISCSSIVTSKLGFCYITSYWLHLKTLKTLAGSTFNLNELWVQCQGVKSKWHMMPKVMSAKRQHSLHWEMMAVP